ncbi:MAG TPA: hypothetical protein VNX68_16470 [Nitrosopumilaceae archaeon]|nr:hypothetical protein [Nitrosopumilaceae archaeon]
MAHKYNFVPQQLKDFKDVKAENIEQNSATDKQEEALKAGQTKIASIVPSINSGKQTQEETELEKLEKANAIRDVLSRRILKQKGGTFDQLEEDIKSHLKGQLSDIFKDRSSRVSLSSEEVTILKVFCQRLKEKEGKK